MSTIIEEDMNPSIEKEKLSYLRELFSDKSFISQNPEVFYHVGVLVDREHDLPDPEGSKVTKFRKVYMPDSGSGNFNFVGRILGPNGSTAKCLQQCLGVKIMVRGRGSTRDKKKEDANLGRPNWEHLNDRLHILLTAEDYENRVEIRLQKASEYIEAFLKRSVSGSEREDKLKQMQLMELSFRREPKHQWRHNQVLLDKTAVNSPINQSAALFNLAAGYGSNAAAHHHLFPTLPIIPNGLVNQSANNGTLSSVSSTASPSTVGAIASSTGPTYLMGPGLAAAAAAAYLNPFLTGTSSHSPTAAAAAQLLSQSQAAALALAQLNFWATATATSPPLTSGHAGSFQPTASTTSDYDVGQVSSDDNHQLYLFQPASTSTINRSDWLPELTGSLDPQHYASFLDTDSTTLNNNGTNGESLLVEQPSTIHTESSLFMSDQADEKAIGSRQPRRSNSKFNKSPTMGARFVNGGHHHQRQPMSKQMSSNGPVNVSDKPSHNKISTSSSKLSTTADGQPGSQSGESNGRRSDDASSSMLDVDWPKLVANGVTSSSNGTPSSEQLPSHFGASELNRRLLGLSLVNHNHHSDKQQPHPVLSSSTSSTTGDTKSNTAPATNESADTKSNV